MIPQYQSLKYRNKEFINTAHPYLQCRFFYNDTTTDSFWVYFTLLYLKPEVITFGTIKQCLIMLCYDPSKNNFVEKTCDKLESNFV